VPDCQADIDDGVVDAQTSSEQAEPVRAAPKAAPAGDGDRGSAPDRGLTSRRTRLRMSYPLAHDSAAEGIPVRLTYGCAASARRRTTPASLHQSARSGGCARSRSSGRPCCARVTGAAETCPAQSCTTITSRHFTAAAANQVWVTDITEHPIRQGQALLLRDQGPVQQPNRRLRPRRADDRAAGRHGATHRGRPSPTDGVVVVNSDRGSQFRARTFPSGLGGCRLRGSMGRVATRRGTTPGRVVLGAAAEDRARPAALALPRQAHNAVVVWIEHAYNRRRRQRESGNSRARPRPR
jgi:hypothetical protein